MHRYRTSDSRVPSADEREPATPGRPARRDRRPRNRRPRRRRRWRFGASYEASTRAGECSGDRAVRIGRPIAPDRMIGRTGAIVLPRRAPVRTSRHRNAVESDTGTAPATGSPRGRDRRVGCVARRLFGAVIGSPSRRASRWPPSLSDVRWTVAGSRPAWRCRARPPHGTPTPDRPATVRRVRAGIERPIREMPVAAQGPPPLFAAHDRPSSARPTRLAPPLSRPIVKYCSECSRAPVSNVRYRSGVRRL